MITVLCGGVGGSRLMRALANVLAPERLTAVINTGDDAWFHGLYVSPDPDIVTYALAGHVDAARGWGLHDDTFRWNAAIGRFGHETWFQIGDRDLATHVHRTRLLREGATLSQAMTDIARAFGVRSRLLPMSDDRVRTVVETDAGDLPFQRYLVERHAQDAVRGVRYDGAANAVPAPGVLEAIAEAEAIVVAPSNPIGSIGPILSVPGVRDAVSSSRATRVAVSGIIGGRSLQPPAGEMLAGMGYTVDVAGVAAYYAGLIDTLIIDEADAALAAAVQACGLRARVTPTLMRDASAGAALARVALAAAGVVP
ncbi:MAG: 2-phospho-L-lactate transferase [Chloroflexi bacterium]|nr:2-phospho-L-lactate transferase [Chloroflexota bacterium]